MITPLYEHWKLQEKLQIQEIRKLKPMPFRISHQHELAANVKPNMLQHLPEKEYMTTSCHIYEHQLDCLLHLAAWIHGSYHLF
nr:hypothetical protein Iba_chr06bCG14970 [Ipomoea batatas]GMD08189.1 hypothetical protein Iba_chr06cCG14330 [Ipomoea batatas]